METLEQEKQALQRALEAARKSEQEHLARLAVLQEESRRHAASAPQAIHDMAPVARVQTHAEAELQAALEHQLRLERQRHNALASMLSRAEQDAQSLRSQAQRDREDWEQRYAEVECRLQQRTADLDALRRQTQQAEQSVETHQRQADETRRELREQSRALQLAETECERLRFELRQADVQQENAGGDWKERIGQLQQELQARSDAEFEAARRLRLLRQQFEDQQERLDNAEAQRDQLKQRIEGQQQSLDAARSQLEERNTMWTKQRDSLAQLQRRCSELELELKEKTIELKLLERQQEGAHDQRQQATNTIEQLQRALKAHQVALEQLPPPMPRFAPATDELPRQSAHYDQLVESLKTRRDANSQRAMERTPRPAESAAIAPAPPAASGKNAPPNDDASLLPSYPSEITRVDPALGVVFTERPDAMDDLRQIHGVAKVLEGKLHAMGIYTYRQILEWDDDAIDLVSHRIAFKDRIRRDHWVQQVQQLYRAKYGAHPKAA